MDEECWMRKIERFKQLPKKAIKKYFGSFLAKKGFLDQEAHKEIQKVASEITQTDKNYVWAFNAGQSGNDFRGNPKYLFIYVNKYRKDITAYWLSGSEKTTAFVRSLGYCAYTVGTLEANLAAEKTGVLVAEQVKIAIPDGMHHVKYLNLYHGVGAKDVERVLVTGGMAENLAHKYILHNQFYRNNQLFLCPSPMMEEDFKRMCGVDEDKVVCAGYPRNIYQKYFEPIVTFPHDLLAQKGLDAEYKLAVYAPTYRQGLTEDTFHLAIPDMDRLIEVCKKKKLLFIFKMHPVMENEYAYLKMKEKYKKNPYVWFWDNKDDFYEIIDKIDLAVIDYSSIFTDFVSAGVPHYIRYVFDYEEAVTGLNHDYMKVTTGKLCYCFEELLDAMETYRERDDLEGIQRINDLYWKHSGKDSFEKIIRQTLEFVPQDRTFPTLYSFDIFDTLISRKVLAPEGIFYRIQERMREEGQDYPEHFVEHYPEIRMHAEKDVREYYHKTMETRHSERREIYMKDIFDKLQWIYGLTDEQASFLMETEKQEELDNSIPLEENIQKVKDLIARNETVVLISDMYLPTEVVTAMLEKADPALAKLPLFLSSEYGVQKTTKKLFMEVYKSFHPFYDFGKWIHFGDTRLPDVTMPRRLGIVARQVAKPEFNEYENMLVSKLGTYDSYLVAALMARFRAKHIFAKEKFTYNYVSLCFVPYISWVLRDAVQRGYETLYFISRDGHFLKKIADVIIEKRNLPIRTKYIYASRRTWRIPSCVNEIDEGFWLNYGNFSGVDSYKKLLKAMSITEEQFMELFPKLAYLKQSGEISLEEREKLIEIIKNSDAYREVLLEEAKKLRIPVGGYLEQEINPNEKFAMVEYWGRGYTQESFTSIWKTIAGEDVKSYFYYSRTILPSNEDNIRYNFTTNSSSQIFIEAIFANMPYKSIEGYQEVNGKYEPVIEPIICDEELFEDMEKYLVQFAGDYESLELTDRDRTDRELYNFILDYYQEYQEDEMFVHVLAPLIDSVSIYGAKQEFAPAFTEADLQKMREKVQRGHLTRSTRISVARAFQPVQEEYRKMYQLRESDRQNTGYLLPDSTIKKNEMYAAETKKYIKGQIKKQEIYNQLAEKYPVENKILLMADEKELSYTGFYMLNQILEQQKDFQVRQIGVGESEDHEHLLAEIASARFILSLKPLIYLSMLKLREETQIIVLGESAFPYIYGKHDTPRMSKKQKEYEQATNRVDISQVQISSDYLISALAERYDIKRENSFRIRGNCQTDIYFNPTLVQSCREKLWKAFPEAKGRTVILYIPSVRYRTKQTNYKEFLNLNRLKELLGDGYAVISHIPMMDLEVVQPLTIKGFAQNITPDLFLREAVCAADIVVGDYRDTFFEATIAKKPVFMTSYDADTYLKDRKTICPIEDVLVGPVIDSEEGLAKELGRIDRYDFSKEEAFRKKYLTYCDGKSSQRVVDYLVSNK